VRGAVKPDAVVVTGTAELVFGDEVRDQVAALLQRKYGIQQRLLSWMESRRKGPSADRVILRITPN
jgi:hypothetical protein